MRKTIYLPVTVLLFTVINASCSKSPAELVKHYAEVYNRHNVGEIVSLYAESAKKFLALLPEWKQMDR